MVNGFLLGPINFFVNPSILDLWQGSDDVFVGVLDKSNKGIKTTVLLVILHCKGS